MYKYIIKANIYDDILCKCIYYIFDEFIYIYVNLVYLYTCPTINNQPSAIHVGQKASLISQY